MNIYTCHFLETVRGRVKSFTMQVISNDDAGAIDTVKGFHPKGEHIRTYLTGYALPTFTQGDVILHMER